MAPRRLHLDEMMVLVAFAALDCTVIPVADHFAAGLAIGVALQVGLLLMLRSRGRRRRFWVGFEVTGSALLLSFFACKTLSLETVCRWPLFLFDNPYNFIDIHDSLNIWEMVIVFELSYGLPMLLIAVSGGLLASFLHHGYKVERETRPSELRTRAA